MILCLVVPVFDFCLFQKLLNSSAIVNSGYSSEDAFQKFFSQIPRDWIERLYHYYKLDFEMFGYDPPTEYIDMGYVENEHNEETLNDDNKEGDS